MLTELKNIDAKLQMIIDEPLKSAVCFLTLGIETKNINDFINAETNAIKAYNMTNDIEKKISALFIAFTAISHGYDYDMRIKRIKTLFDIFISDKEIESYFEYLSYKKYDNLTIAKHVTSSVVLFILGLTLVLLPVYAFYKWEDVTINVFVNFRANWGNRYDIENVQNMIILGVTNNTCIYDECLGLIGMANDTKILASIDSFLMLYHTFINTTKENSNNIIKLKGDIEWIPTNFSKNIYSRELMQRYMFISDIEELD
jgi:hypothetical protein